MPEVSQPPRQLLLDLRKTKRSSLPAIDGLTVVNPNPSAECGGAGSALAVFVALDGEAAYADWLQRFHPMCPSGFPNVMLLDPYDPVLARRILRGDAADCCAMDDVERIELIVTRLERQQLSSDCRSDLPSPRLTHLLRLQATVDTMPVPVFIKDRERRYIACNKAFEAYIGRSASEIIGKTVYDVAPSEMAAVYEKADIEHLERGGTHTYETRVRYADGSIHDVVFQKAVFLDAAGRRTGSSA